MDQQRFFLTERIENFPRDLFIPEINEETKTTLKKMIVFGEELQGIRQLFDIFIFNLEHMDEFCTMYYNDEIIKKKDGSSVTFTEINAFLINVIGAGKTLTEAIEKFLNEEIGEETGENFKKNYLSKKYDESFSYRFLLYLRNLSQHGYLPVSQNFDGRFCFDLAQIINTRHIKPNAAIKKSMEDVYVELVEKVKTEPHIAFTYTLATFSLVVVEIYYNFLKEIELEVRLHHEQRNICLEQHPELIFSQLGNLKNMVVFNEDNGALHMFSKEDNIWNMYVNLKKQAKEKVKLFNRIHTESLKLL